MKFTFIFMLFTCSLSAQSFYIEPTIQTKASFTTTNTQINSSLVLNTSSYIQTESMKIIYPQNLSPLTFGLNIGFQSNSNKTRLSLGINGDNSTSGFEYKVLAYDFETNRPYTTGGFYYDGRSYANLRLQIEQTFGSIGNSKFNFLLGVGGALRKNNLPVSYGIHGITVFLPDSSVQEVFYELKNTGVRFGLNYTLGIKGDVYSKKGKYILSSSLFYTHGTKPLTTVYQYLNNYSNPSENYSNTFYSKGSGIYLQVSRRLQYYPWKGFKKKSEI